MTKNIILIVMVVVGILFNSFIQICLGEETSQNLVSTKFNTDTSYDHFIGWYKITGNDELVPVIKMDNTYYSVCRGFEIPLKECPEGLEWNVTPSSMVGTKIGYDKSSATYYIAVMDNQASNFTDGKYGIGEKESMIKVEKPVDILDTTTKNPKSMKDLLGIYQSLWLPGLRFEIRKRGEKYYYTFQSYKENSWKDDDFTKEIKSLSDRLGFSGFEENMSLLYNDNLHRYEIIDVDKNRQPETIRMPMVRNPQILSSKSIIINSPKLKIGIPSWH